MSPTYVEPTPMDPEPSDGCIAVIDVCGMLSESARSFEEYYGWATRYSTVLAGVQQAIANPACMGILIRFNSPGGDTDMAFEAADELAGLMGQKPCYAVAAPHCYSAAFLLASQCDEVWCPPKSGGVGSVGVYTAHIDYSELLAKEGIKVTLISEGEGKTDGNPWEPLSASALADIKASVAKSYGYFVEAVAAGRDMKASAIRKMGAAIFDGQEAIDAGYADATGSDLQCLSALVDLCRTGGGKTSKAASALRSQKEVPEMGTEVNAADASKPAVDMAEVMKKAKADGYAEAALIVDICTIGRKPDLAAGFISERKSIDDVRVAMLAEAKKAGDEGGEINTAILPADGARSEAKPAKSLAEKMKEMHKGVK